MNAYITANNYQTNERYDVMLKINSTLKGTKGCLTFCECREYFCERHFNAF